MIELTVNAKAVHTAAATLDALLGELNFEPPFATALNGVFVPRSHYEATELNSGDAVDVVSPVGGG